MNAPETTRMRFKKGQWEDLWLRLGGEPPEDWGETTERIKDFSVAEGRELFVRFPTRFEKAEEKFDKEWRKQRGMQAVLLRKWEEEKIRHLEDILGHKRDKLRNMAVKLKAFFGKPIPWLLLTEEEKTELTRGRSGA